MTRSCCVDIDWLSGWLTVVFDRSSVQVRTDPGQSWKVVEFKNHIFQAWKVMQSGLGHGRSLKTNRCVEKSGRVFDVNMHKNVFICYIVEFVN